MSRSDDGSPRRRGRRTAREFLVQLSISNLSAMPFTNEKFTCRWKISREIAKPFQGETNEATHAGQNICFNYDTEFHVKIRSEPVKREYLVNTFMVIEVRCDDPDPNARRIGALEVNLALFAGIGRRTNRYLLQDAKCNGLLEISLWLRQTAGDNIFLPPRGNSLLSSSADGFGNENVQERSHSTRRSGYKSRQTDSSHELLETIPELSKDVVERLLAQRYYERTAPEIESSRGNPAVEMDEIFQQLRLQYSSHLISGALDPQFFQNGP